MEVVWGFLNVAEEKMAGFLEDLRDFFHRDWTVAEKVLVIVCCVLFGLAKGSRSAKTRDISIGSHNGNGNTGDIYEAPFEFEEE